MLGELNATRAGQLAFLPADEAGAAWRTLETGLAVVPLAASWDWIDTWLRHFKSVVPHSFVALVRDGEPAALALVTEEHVRKGPFRIRRAHLGTAGEPAGESVHVEYNDLLGDPDARAELAAALVAELHAGRWDELAIDGFTEAGAELFTGADDGFELTVEPAPLARLGGDVIEGLSSSVRQRVRRSLRGFGEVETEWADGPDRALAVLDELIDLHQRRWREAGEAGAFASDRFRAFHRDLVERLVPRGAALLFRARAADETIGCLYSFIDGDRVLFYQSGFGAFEDNKLRPGLTAHVLCMQACGDRGLREYDFLAGESRYKRELASAETQLVWGVLRRRSLKSRALDALRRLRP
jgi:CelD/BcsL family acetyltransferase involved in cellulose biosynthesis